MLSADSRCAAGGVLALAAFRGLQLRRRQRISAIAALAAILLVFPAVRRIRAWLKRYRSQPAVFPREAPVYLRWSAQKLAKALRQGDLQAVELIEACISALESTSALNSMATTRFDEARAEAAATTIRFTEARNAGRAGELPPFLGVPIILKEAFEYTGMQYTWGLLSRRGIMGKQKGPVVRRVEEAGFIVLGFGNISEATMWMESYNRVYGRSSNPFDPSLTPGGSSGGTAAAVATLGAPVGVTADIGGSTRIPAHFCGLFGHKPTGGLVPNTATHMGNFHGAVHRICQLGAVTRHAEDLLPMIRIMAGPPSPDEDADAGLYLPAPHWSATQPDLKHLKVIPLTFRGGLPSSPFEVLISSPSVPQLEAQSMVVTWFKNQGCEVQPMHFEDLRVGDWFGAWADRNQCAGGPCFREVICRGKPLFGVGELVRYALGRSDHTAPALGLAFLENIIEMFSLPVKKRLGNAQSVEDLLAATLGDNGVFVMPTLPRHGCKHDELILRLFDSSFTCVWNAMEFPATAVPLGLDARGLPVSVQLISTRGRDELTMSLAHMLEEAGIARCVAPDGQ